MKEKEIHFWKDAFGLGSLYESVLKSHNATLMSIDNGWDTIHTYAISALDFADLLDKGYNIYLHENSKSCQIKEGKVECTDKEIRKGHDIRRIWIGGGFDDYFYEND